MNRSTDVAKSLGGAAKSSSETPVSSAEDPAPVDDGTGNTPSTRPHPSIAKTLSGRDPPLSTDHDADHGRSNVDRAPKARVGAKGTTPQENDYTDASGRDRPAESEHDHTHQKLNGESARMAAPKPTAAR